MMPFVGHLRQMDAQPQNNRGGGPRANGAWKSQKPAFLKKAIDQLPEVLAAAQHERLRKRLKISQKRHSSTTGRKKKAG